MGTVVSLGVVGCGSDSATPTPTPNTTPNTTAPAASASPTPTVDEPTPIEAAAPGTPASAYLQGTSPMQLHLPNGEVWELPQPYRGGRLVGEVFFGIYNDLEAGSDFLQGVRRDGTIDSYGEIRSPLAVNVEGTTVAWVDDQAQMQVGWEGGGTAIGRVPRTSMPVRITGGPGCAETEDGCQVFYAGGDKARVIDSRSGVSTIANGVRRLNDVVPSGSIAVQTSSTDDGSCSEVRALTSGDQAPATSQTCEFSLGRFSPDASYLTAYDDYLDGIGPSYVSILDATSLDEVARLTPDGFLSSAAWEDSEHLLATTYDRRAGAWSVDRLGLDGSSETVLGPVRGSETEPAFTLLGDG